MLTPDKFKDMMSAVAATTTVVTIPPNGVSDSPSGMTVSAFTSVSADPPVVLVCVDKRSASLEAFLATESYTVNFLPQGTGDLAMLFATSGADKFGDSNHTPPSSGVGGAVLDQAYGHFECNVVRSDEVGDHWVIYGEVIAGGRTDPDGEPLLYVHRGFARAIPDGA
ncbi:MAG: flavin reductase family protein [Acidimicrobiia bacterium]